MWPLLLMDAGSSLPVDSRIMSSSFGMLTLVRIQLVYGVLETMCGPWRFPLVETCLRQDQLTGP